MHTGRIGASLRAGHCFSKKAISIRNVIGATYVYTLAKYSWCSSSGQKWQDHLRQIQISNIRVVLVLERLSGLRLNSPEHTHSCGRNAAAISEP